MGKAVIRQATRASGRQQPVNRAFGPYQSWQRMHAKLPSVLYHYTTAQGLLGILESGSLWTTNSRFLNDPTEIEYATRLFRRVATEEFSKYDPNPPAHVKNWKKWVTFWLDYYEKEAKVYVACFCAKGDLLSQWRGYGAAGGGYALGFATKHLSQSDGSAQQVWASFMKAGTSPLKAVPLFLMRKVIYNPATQEGLVRERVKALCEPGKCNEPGSPAGAYPGLEWFSFFFSECLNCLKHPAFEEEQEWRAIQFGRVEGRDRPDLKFYFRTSGGRIIDYTKVDLKAAEGKYQGMLPISVVRYGPTLEPKTTERSLQILLSAHGYNADLVKLERSLVPFTG